MTDIVERLRIGEPCSEAGYQCKVMEAKSGCHCAIAADEIERLRKREHSLVYSLTMILADLDATAKIGYIPNELLNDHIYITARKLLVKENGNGT